MVYKVRSGTIDSGKAYEINLISLFALRCAGPQTRDVWFATNADGCGDFDDIIIYWKDVSTEELFMVQCKHSDTQKTIMQREFLKSKNSRQNNFSLEKYSNGYFSSWSGSKRIICDTIWRSKENLKFILLTNNNVIADDILEDVSCDSLFFLNTSGKGYRFKCEKLNELIVNEQLRVEVNNDFIRKLTLFSNQVHNKNIASCTAKQLRELIFPGCIAEAVLKDILLKYVCFIHDWAHGKLGGHYLLTKTHITTKLTELLLEHYMFVFWNKTYEVQENCRFDSWNSIILDRTITVVELDDNEEIVFNFLYGFLCYKITEYTENLYDSTGWGKAFPQEVHNKFYQTADKCLKNEMLRTIGNMGRITLYHLYKVLWKMKRIPLVLQVSNSEDYKNILHILRLTEYKLQVIILDKSKSKQPHVKGTPAPFTNFTHLNRGEDLLVLDEMVQLQGRPIQLKWLIKMHKLLRRFITTKDIIHIFSKNPFNIGNTFKELPIYHIARTIPKLLLDMTEFKKIVDHSNDIFEVWCKDERHYFKNDKFIPNNEFEIRKHPNKIIHKLLMDDPQDPNLEWVESTGNTKIIKSLLSHEPNEKIKPVNSNDVLTHFTHKINVISAHPGMGKSTMMNFLALNAPVDKWVLRIGLNEYSDYYETTEFEKSHADPARHLMYFNRQILIKQGRNGALDMETFTFFLKKESLIILLDGFDEISPYYKDRVTKMIQTLSWTENRIWLTTRPALKSYIEQTFDTIAVTLNALTQDEQKYFLTTYYEKALGKEDYREKLTDFVEMLLNLVKSKIKDVEPIFTGIPLQALLLAEVFTDGCKNYIEGRAFSAEENFDLHYLYEKLSERKLQILSEKYGDYVKQEQFETYQQLCALKALFPEKILKGLEVNEQLTLYVKLLPNVTELVQKHGIIVAETETDISFTHRTFGEYFAAKWLSVNFKNPNAKSLIKTLFEEDFYVVRNMFDRILAKDCPLHMAVINYHVAKAKDLMKTNPELLNKEDAGGRLPIHLVASYGNQHPMPEKGKLAESSVHCIKSELKFNNGSIEIVRDDKSKDILADMCDNMELLHRDKALGFTAVDYAIASNCLANLNVILSSWKGPISIFLEKHEIKPYLYYCARYGYRFLMKAILPYVVHISSQVDINPTITVPSTKNIKHHLYHYATYSYNFLAKRVAPNNVQINSQIDDHGRTALHWAASAEDLYRRGMSSRRSYTTVYYSLEKNSFDTVYLLLCCGADVKSRDKDGSTVLHYAAAQSCANTMSLLLANGADINARNNYNETALHKAANAGSTNNVSFLLSRGASPHAKTKRKSNAVHYAACKGYTDVVSVLIDSGIDINATNESYETALYLAVKFDCVAVVSLLLSHGAQVYRTCGEKQDMNVLHYAIIQGSSNIISLLLSNGSDINLKDSDGMTALHHAVQWRYDSDIASLLLSNSADPNIDDNKGETALHYAAAHRRTNAINLLLANGADIHARDKDDKTALHHVVKYRFYSDDFASSASLLLANGADPNARDKDGKTILHYAAETNCGDTMALLISNGANPTARDVSGKTPLHYAVKTFSTHSVRLLLNQAGVDPNAKDNCSKTALHYLIRSPVILFLHFHEDIIAMLLKVGADINVKDKDGITVLHQAAEEGSKDVVSFLLTNGADVHARDREEKTPLHYAVRQYWLVPLLLSNGADVNAEDKYGNTVLYYARKRGCKDAVKILQRYGAKKR